ncbi:unnamed protein product [Cylicocyclus nassatus]|uniref:Condensin complex subunit 1 C-terminal domain-containing protein n=1 Tax=Cylicocyclus nassatus TaxID=53992 RepID=A0AA36MF99_CYLNA|nr:unnamed protein product [Cylicocyclus nassatus]
MKGFVSRSRVWLGHIDSLHQLELRTPSRLELPYLTDQANGPTPFQPQRQRMGLHQSYCQICRYSSSEEDLRQVANIKQAQVVPLNGASNYAVPSTIPFFTMSDIHKEILQKHYRRTLLEQRPDVFHKTMLMCIQSSPKLNEIIACQMYCYRDLTKWPKLNKLSQAQCSFFDRLICELHLDSIAVSEAVYQLGIIHYRFAQYGLKPHFLDIWRQHFEDLLQKVKFEDSSEKAIFIEAMKILARYVGETMNLAYSRCQQNAALKAKEEMDKSLFGTADAKLSILDLSVLGTFVVHCTMSCIAELKKLLSSEFSSMEDISNEWVQSSIDGNYHEFATISAIFKPSFYEDDRATMRLRQLSNSLERFLEDCDDSEIWTEMTNIELSGKQLCVLLWYAVEWALEKDSTFDAFEKGVLASCAYLRLASITGSNAYSIFNPHLYQKCLLLFRSLYRCLTYDARAMTSTTKQKQKRKRQEVTNDNVESAEETFAAAFFDKGEVKHLLEMSTEALFTFLNKVPLSGYSGMSHETAVLIRDLGRIDIQTNAKVGIVKSLVIFKDLRKFVDRSFALMHLLIDERHTPDGYIVYSRIVYPRLAYWTFDCAVIPSSSTIPVIFNVWKDLMVAFIKERAQVGNLRELTTAFKVLENLYQRCTDRLDYRTRLAQSVFSVLQVLPRIFHYEFVQRIDCFSRSQKVSVRNFTTEITPLILTNFVFTDPEPGFYDEMDNIYVNTVGVEANTTSRSSIPPEDEQNVDGDKSDSESDSSERQKSKDRCGLHGGSSSETGKRGETLPKKTPERVPVLPALYTCIIRCCLDKASSVRVRAMYHLAALLSHVELRVQLCNRATLMFEESPKIFVGGFNVNEKEAEEDEEEIDEMMFLDDSEITIDNVMLHIILTGIGDDTAGVRKYSLMALQAFFPSLEQPHEVASAVECVKDRCLDSSLMVRKQAAEVLSYLFNTFSQHREALLNAWLGAVLPMINDSEQSVQQLISQTVTKTVLDPLLGLADDTKLWKLLHAVEMENNNRRLLARAFTHQHLEKNVASDIVKALNHKLDECPEHSNVIWMLLADLGTILKVEPHKAVSAWYAFEDDDQNSRVRYVTQVLARGSASITKNDKKSLIGDFENKIANFRIHAPNISSAYCCLAELLDGVREEGAGKSRLKSFGKQVLNTCRVKIRESLLAIEEELDEENSQRLALREILLIRMVVTIGEVVQLSPELMRTGLRHFDALKTVLASDIFNDDELPVINSAVPSLAPSPSSSRAPSPAQSVASSEGGSSQPASSASQPTSVQSGPVIPQHIVKEAMSNRRPLLTAPVRAYAVCTIGKFCLMDEKIAKATIPVFVKQLKLNPDHVIRNNIAMVVCDLCKRYTLMVDRYSPIVAACLKDRSTLVRQQVLESLTSLIKEQYIRWEGQIMYRFVSTILDENEIISDYAKFCLRDVLLLQFPSLFENHFIECLMYFNNVPMDSEREAANPLDQAHRVCLHGLENLENRMAIYKFMISTFDDPRKFTLMAQICTQIFCPLMNGKIKYEDRAVQDLVKDALLVMSLREIKLNMDVGRTPDEEEEPPTAVVAAAKDIIVNAFRKAMLDYVMPTLLDLRMYLNERRSGLRKYLYAVFRVICREHKEQIDAFLDGDQQLKAEVEYDIRKYEQHLRAERAAVKRRAEKAALERRLSRRSLGAARHPDNHQALDIGTSVRNSGRDLAEDLKMNEEKEYSSHKSEDSMGRSNAAGAVPVIPFGESAPQRDAVTEGIKNSENEDKDHGQDHAETAEKENFVKPSGSILQNQSRPLASASSRSADQLAARTPMSSTISSAYNGWCARAASTPVKESGDLTFADLNLSAIPSSSEESLKFVKKSVRERTLLTKVDEGTSCDNEEV